MGAYYFWEEANGNSFANFAEGGTLQVEGPVFVNNTNYAAFGQLDWRLTDFIGVTLGARYTTEEKEFEAGQRDHNGFAYKLFNCTIYSDPCQSIIGNPDPNDPLRVYIPGIQTKTFENFSPKVGIQLHPNDDIMLYGSYSEGYKTGGWSTRLESPLGYAPDFDEEEAATYEIGVKATLNDNRIQANAALFSTEYTNIQLLFQTGASPIIENAGTATIEGFEADVTALVNDWLSITSSVGYLDSELTEILDAALSQPNQDQAGLIVGAGLPKVPEWSFNLSPAINIPTNTGGELSIVGDYTYTSSVWNDSQRTFVLQRPDLHLFNASVTYHEPGRQWYVTVGGTNLTDERYVVNGVAQLAGGLIYGSPNRPREWYAKLGFEF